MHNRLLGEPEFQVSGWGIAAIIAFTLLFALFVWRITASQMGFPVPAFTLGAAVISNWAIVALSVATMFSCWRYNKRPYKLELWDMFRDNAAWAGFFMALCMGAVALGAIYRLY